VIRQVAKPSISPPREIKDKKGSQIRKAALYASVIADTLKWSNQKQNQMHNLTH
jgi:hypothetical protein